MRARKRLALVAVLAMAFLTIHFLGKLPTAYADTFGNTSISGMAAYSRSGTLFFARFAAPTGGSLSSISFYAGNPSGSGNVGIYTDNAGVPAAFLAQGTPQGLSEGWNTFSSLSASVTITAGINYWLALAMTSGYVYASSTGSGLKGLLTGECCTMPNQIPAAQVTTASGSFGIYATYTTGPPPPPPFDFSLSSSGGIIVTQGGSGSNTITATLTSGSSQSVSLSCTSGLPSGASCSFNPVSGSPTLTSTLTISTSSSTPTGSFTIAVTGTGGGLSRSTSFTLTVNALVGPDFTLSSSPTSQNIAAGSSVTYTLSISALGGYGESVSLAATSGCPAASTCTIGGSPIASPYSSTATLTVQTASTTAGGTYTIVVTGTGTTKTHTVSVSLTVAGPTPYNFNVKAGATQIVVTVSWTSTGSASVTIQGPGGTPTLSESGAVVYDRTSMVVVSGSPTYSSVHRVTFTITAPASAQAWTLLLSISGPTSYNIAIEVS